MFVAATSFTDIAFLNGDPANDTENGLDNVDVSLVSETAAPVPALGRGPMAAFAAILLVSAWALLRHRG
ncbi:MAG: hypothetical protein ACRD16_09430 [Thermoanaerobaculia bacterium]